MMALEQLFLVRHGETDWSLSGQHTGRTDVPLTAKGEWMARALEPCLRQIAFSRVLTSPRLRARRTCELAGLGMGDETELDLAEWDYGDYEGMRTAEIHTVAPLWDLWRDGCPGGETPAQVSDRADRVIARLEMLTGNVALFSHGHFGRVLAARWIAMPAFAGRHFALDPASISILGYEDKHSGRRALTLWNAVPSSRLLRTPCADGGTDA
jgi:probable phosphoglycerate mutase